MDFLSLVTSARTCRRFCQNEPLPSGFLTWLVDCARLTPSAKNQQALRYAIIESREACEAFFPALRWAGALPDWPGPKEGERPTGYIVILANPEKKARFCRLILVLPHKRFSLQPLHAMSGVVFSKPTMPE